VFRERAKKAKRGSKVVEALSAMIVELVAVVEEIMDELALAAMAIKNAVSV
jgi:hypothetical protein